VNDFDARVALLKAQLNAGDIRLKVQSPSLVPPKKKSKPVSYKMQNTFEKNLRGIPGGRSLVKQADAPRTGTKVRKEGIGLLRSSRNANTTQGNYTRSVVTDEQGNVVSDAQGRKVFGK
jgi:hypothetical protein